MCGRPGTVGKFSLTLPRDTPIVLPSGTSSPMLQSHNKRCLLMMLAVMATLANGGAMLDYACVAAHETCKSSQSKMACCSTDSCCCCSTDETTEECGCKSGPAPSVPVQETPITVSFGDRSLVLPSLTELVLPTPAKCHGTHHMTGVCPAASGGLCVRNCVWQT
jgi:hypothetical protein